jgi:hypothetical protein
MTSTAKLFSLMVMSQLLLSISGYSQEAAFEPNGKPVLRIFTNFNTTFRDGASTSGFHITRVYLGYEHNFTERLSVKAVLDVGDPGLLSFQRLAYVKNAYLRYKVNGLSVSFGLISTTQFRVQEKAWGYRYHLKSFQDQYKFNSSADLGLSVVYKINDIVSADLIIANGEGYKRLQSDSTLRTGLGVTVTPGLGFTGRVYYDIANREDLNQQSLATFVGYVHDRFNLGAEYMIQFNPFFQEKREVSGWSFWGTFNASKKFKVFGRFDQLVSNRLEGHTLPWNIDDNGQLYVAGFEYSPTNGIRLAPNFKGWSPADQTRSFIASVFLNVEVFF